MQLLPGAKTPYVTSELKVTVQPRRAAVFLDGSYVGHASELGGKFHSLLVSPGRHKINVELPGYRTFETEVEVIAGQKSEVKTELVKGSIEQAGSDIKKPAVATLFLKVSIKNQRATIKELSGNSHCGPVRYVLRERT